MGTRRGNVMDDTRYRLIRWRKRLERRGWHNARRFAAPRDHWIEYHVVWSGRLWSGRCHLGTCSMEDFWQPGTHVYLIHRMQDVQEGVWRRTDRRGAGLVWRPLSVALKSTGP